MNREMIEKVEAFLKDTFENSEYLQAHPTERDYRLEHSYRVANIAKNIAENESFDVNCAVIAGLLHDISYCEEMKDRADWVNHGRRSAQIVRIFLEELGLSSQQINDICYGLAIHVDDQADFEWTRSAFCETVGDADNIDRFDAYRIYETLQNQNFSAMKLPEKGEIVHQMLEKLDKYREIRFGTETAQNLWLQRLDYYRSFYQKLTQQLNNSTFVL